MLKKKKAFVLGLGKSGCAAARFLIKQGYSVVAADANICQLSRDPQFQELLQGVEYSDDSVSFDFTTCDYFILSPGISIRHPLVEQALSVGVEVIGEIELAARHMRQPAIGITGTNGKTTVTLLVAHILNYCGIKACAVGNVGHPLTEELMKAGDNELLVIELSSYQLETLLTPLLNAAVILNISPDHLDRYSSLEAYAKAKVHIGKCLKKRCPLFVESKAYHNYHKLFKGFNPVLYGYSPTCTFWSDRYSVFYGKDSSFALPLDYRGKISHDIENLIAAFALCHQQGIGPDAFLEALATFSKPPHRIEFVGKVRGSAYINDSKGTNIDAVVRAVESIEGNIVLIAGGVDKGAPFTSWIENFAGKVKCICAIGEAAKKMETELSHALPVKRFNSLKEAVMYASTIVHEGETVLLSPGCSSFDMFKDYAHRGDVFKQIVADL